MSEPADCVKKWIKATAPANPLQEIDALRRALASYEVQARRNDVSDNMCDLLQERLQTLQKHIDYWRKLRPTQDEMTVILQHYA